MDPADAHRKFMHAAMEQARAAMAEGNMPIGAVVVHDGRIVGVGRNAIDNPPDDTHHAELRAIQAAASFLAEHKHECTIYTTLEPCMMCLGAIVNVGIDRVIIAAPDSHVGALELLPHGAYYRRKLEGMSIVTGVLEAESQTLLNEYVRKTGWRPHLARGAA
jgi:tRNA(adenine34) deaminase